MDSFFSSLKTERTSNKTYRTRNEAKADVVRDNSPSLNGLMGLFMVTTAAM
jgi:hypothetical protein